MGGAKSKIMGAAGAIAGLFHAASAHAQEFADPAGSGVLVSAVRWLEGTLLGTIATVIAVIAVATVGFMMLTGRINWRYRSDEHTSELQSLMRISYAVFCLKKKI